MAPDRSRRYDDEDDDRPRRGRRDDDDRPRGRRRRDEDDYDDDDDRPRRGRGEKSNAGVIVAIVLGGLLVVTGIVAAVLVNRNKDTRDTADQPPASGPFDRGPATDKRPGTPAFDAEGLPLGNDLDSIKTRLNRRFQQNNTHLYQMEAMNLRLNKAQFSARAGEVFSLYRDHAGSPATQPPITSIAYSAWQNAMEWVTKDQVPELCRMLSAERNEARQQDIFGKLNAFKDPRCAAAVAPFLASPQRRSAAESILKELDSSAEPFVLPYLSSNQTTDTRVTALYIVAKIGTKEGAKVVESLTRDADPTVSHRARLVFEQMSKDFGVELNLLAVVKTLKEAITAQNPNAITDCDQQLNKAYRADHPQRAEIFKGLIECCAVNDPKGYGKRAAFVGALKWSSKDDVETLCGLLVSSGGESVVFLKLKEYKDPKCAEVVAAFLTVPLKSGEAAAVLKEVGAPAEKAVIPYTLRAAPNGAPIPFATRSAAIELLGDIGTKESIPVLRQHAAELMVQAVANKALGKVLARIKQ